MNGPCSVSRAPWSVGCDPFFMLRVTPHIFLDESELHEEFVRSAGPGGQNVNKVSTAVQLRFDAANSPNLPDDVRRRLLRMAGDRATAQGEIVIEARRRRTRERNRADAQERLFDLIRRAAKKPKRRVPTRPTRASRERRLEEKRMRSKVKQLRRKDKH